TPSTGGMPDLTGGTPSTPGTVGIGAPVGGRTNQTPFISQYNPAGAGAGYTNGAANCAPASMAMIARSMGLGEGLTDAQLINKLGGVGGTNADGTSINGVVAMANELGVNAEVHGPRADPTWIAQTLAAGKQIVANGDYYAAPGHYEPGRSSGHYITVTGMNQDGTVNVQDPADPNLKTMTMQELATFMNANKINGGYAVAIG
ncbi:MAG TPA: C39 family peptidase, partial [Myxococcaceae bacterium]|nr:C39 family peptidase [Myxococcaceae bacterium]